MKTQIATCISQVEADKKDSIYSDTVEGRIDGLPAAFQYKEYMTKTKQFTSASANTLSIATLLGEDLSTAKFLFIQYRKEREIGAQSEPVDISISLTISGTGRAIGTMNQFMLTGSPSVTDITLTGFSSIPVDQINVLIVHAAF